MFEKLSSLGGGARTLQLGVGSCVYRAGGVTRAGGSGLIIVSQACRTPGFHCDGALCGRSVIDEWRRV